MTTPPKARAVPASFRMPWNTTRSMADVWAVPPLQLEREISRQVAATIPIQPQERPRRLTRQGKIPYAGYDQSEVQVKRVGK